MIEVTEPQVWTLIGVFSAAVFAMLTVVSTLFVNIVRAEIGRVEGVLTAKIDNLDRDVQAIARRVFPEA